MKVSPRILGGADVKANMGKRTAIGRWDSTISCGWREKGREGGGTEGGREGGR